MITVEKDGPVWRLRIARPDRANALTRDMLVTLRDTARAAEGAARVLVLQGDGKVFSAGADLEEVAAGLATDPVWEELSASIAALDALTIAALNGTVAGGALGMVLACDLRVAAAGAKIFYPVMRNGLLPQPSDVRRLGALVGPARKKLLLMAGARLSAEQALQFGLVDRVVPPEGLDACVAELMQDTLNADPGIARQISDLCRTI